MVKEEGQANNGVSGDTNTAGVTRSMSWFVQTTLIAGAAQQIAEVNEIDISIDRITNVRVGRILTKMCLKNDRRSHGGKRG